MLEDELRVWINFDLFYHFLLAFNHYFWYFILFALFLNLLLVMFLKIALNLLFLGISFCSLLY